MDCTDKRKETSTRSTKRSLKKRSYVTTPFMGSLRSRSYSTRKRRLTKQSTKNRNQSENVVNQVNKQVKSTATTISDRLSSSSPRPPQAPQEPQAPPSPSQPPPPPPPPQPQLSQPPLPQSFKRPLICSNCGRKYQTLSTLRRHLRSFSTNTVSHFQHPSQFKHQPQRQRHQSTTISNHSTNTVTNNDTTITSSPCTTTTSSQDCIHNHHTQQLSHTRHHHHHHHHHNLVAPLQPQQLSTSAHFDSFMLNEESFTCPQCFRTYRRHGTLRRHLRQECGKGKSMDFGQLCLERQSTVQKDNGLIGMSCRRFPAAAGWHLEAEFRN
uniref:C2H2-type domain-containing protein n=1 Tax=Glossina pallidipes TaxID=7398 RepID=A0A1B0AHP8_GLOPL